VAACGSESPINDLTLASFHASNDGPISCGAKIFVKDLNWIKTVTDNCGFRCKVPPNALFANHLDNYDSHHSCTVSDFHNLGTFKTIQIY